MTASASPCRDDQVSISRSSNAAKAMELPGRVRASKMA
jgi:hypothetical protein